MLLDLLGNTTRVSGSGVAPSSEPLFFFFRDHLLKAPDMLRLMKGLLSGFTKELLCRTQDNTTESPSLYRNCQVCIQIVSQLEQYKSSFPTHICRHKPLISCL